MRISGLWKFRWWLMTLFCKHEETYFQSFDSTNRCRYCNKVVKREKENK